MQYLKKYMGCWNKLKSVTLEEASLADLTAAWLVPNEAHLRSKGGAGAGCRLRAWAKLVGNME